MKQSSFVFPVLWMLLASACSSAPEPPLCGNGELNFGEDCDGPYVRASAPYTCALFGYNSPKRAVCSPTCKFDPSPCIDSGICGDGIATPGWEQCDGKDNGGQTCESLGFHGGRLFCHEDCWFEISQCLRCGDGVLQPEYGEVLENGPEYCLEAGHLGGFLYTNDCVTPSEYRCGEYALLEPAGSASHPVVSLRGDGELRVIGRATGAYPGFPHPHPECPLLTKVNDSQTDPPQVSYLHDPFCEREFLAIRAPGAVEEVLYQREEDSRVLRQVDLGEQGQVVLRQSPRLLWLEWVNPEGRTRISSRLPMPSTSLIPQLTALPGDRIGVSSIGLDGIILAVFDPFSGAVRVLGTLEHISVDSGIFRPDPASGHRVAWLSEREFWVFARFTEVAGDDTFPALVRVTEEGGHLEVSQVIRNRKLPDVWCSPNLELRLTEDRLEMTWTVYEAVTTRVSRVVFSMKGEPLSTQEFILPSGSLVEAMFVEDDGSVVLAGVAPSAMEPAPSRQTCRPAGTALARWRLDDEFRFLDTRHFRTTAAQWAHEQPDYCRTWERTYDYRGGTLVVAGTYSHREGFCSDRERSVVEEALPVHSCGVYLVRFD